MTINPFDLAAIAAFMAIGLWLETVGGKHGFVDEFFAPIPLAATGCIYAVLRSPIYRKSWISAFVHHVGSIDRKGTAQFP